MRSRNREPVFMEAACGEMVPQAMLLLSLRHLRVEPYQDQSPGYFPLWRRAFKWSGFGLMSLASLEITPHSLHTKAVVSTPASWLFLEKTFLGMPAWLGFVPKML